MITLCFFNCHDTINTMISYCPGFIFQSENIKRASATILYFNLLKKTYEQRERKVDVCSGVIMYRIYIDAAVSV